MHRKRILETVVYSIRFSEDESQSIYSKNKASFAKEALFFCQQLFNLFADRFLVDSAFDYCCNAAMFID